MADNQNMASPQDMSGAHSLQDAQGAQTFQNIRTPSDIPSMQDIHDIEPPIQVGLDPFVIKVALGAVALILIVLIFYFLFRYIRDRRKKQAGNDMLLLPPPLPPREAALRELDAIVDLMQVHPRLFYFRLTALLKSFIGKCFHIHAPEMTTQEIIAALNTIFMNTLFDKELFSSAKSLFDTSSMIKYAAVMPTMEQIKADEDFTRRFIDAVDHYIITTDHENHREETGGQ